MTIRRKRWSCAIGTLCLLLASSGAAIGATWLRDCETLETCASLYLEKIPHVGWPGFSMHVCSGEDHTIEGTDRLAFEVTRVLPESPASTTGIQVGDRVVALNGVEFPTAGGVELLMGMVTDIGVGDRVRYRVLRDDRALSFTIKTVEPPSSVVSRWVLAYLALRFGPGETGRYLKENPLELN